MDYKSVKSDRLTVDDEDSAICLDFSERIELINSTQSLQHSRQ